MTSHENIVLMKNSAKWTCTNSNYDNLCVDEAYTYERLDFVMCAMIIIYETVYQEREFWLNKYFFCTCSDFNRT